ncbi:malonyl-CoA decarboxylase family protein [Comamonas faecalis]|uniref:Malonyl-CoA decarboxylase family protein n=1 Tax=Comamonas faecalis TaxID=1387849 RepID=A0ABP7QEE1_9BURK
MSDTSSWIARHVERLRPAAAQPADGQAAPRSTHERLAATLRRKDEALAPRALRQLHEQLQQVVAPRISEVEAGRRAQAVIDWYAQAPAAQRSDLWALLTEQYAPDTERLKAAHQRYEAVAGTPQAARAEAALRQALVSPRTRLLQRFAVPPGGMRFLVDLRAELLALVRENPQLQALDGELEHLFSTWFDVAFLELRRLSWDSPASLLEKLIQYEAVHDIRSWDDLKNRLDSDRRCYGFFHPSLPGEPLIFVEVALLDALAGSITPLLDEAAAPVDLSRATTAIFYSISSTQEGLRGVSFGDSLIKHVVDQLQAEFARLRHFATLSPIPGFRAWLARESDAQLALLAPRQYGALARAMGVDAGQSATAAQLLAAADQAAQLTSKSPLRAFLLGCAARYLSGMRDGRALDAVARFHLGNGARVEQINWMGDPSAKGLKQSFGLMVNYLYDLKRLDRHRAQLAQGKAAVSSQVQALAREGL